MMRSRRTLERHCYKNCSPDQQLTKPRTAKNSPSECGSQLTDLLWVQWGEPNPHCLAGVAPHLFKKHALLFLKIDPHHHHHHHHPAVQPTDTIFYDLVIYQPMEENNITRHRGTVMFWHMYLYTAWGTSDIMALLNPPLWPWHLHQILCCEKGQ